MKRKRPIAGLLPPAREGLQPWGLVTIDDAYRILTGRVVVEYNIDRFVLIAEMSYESWLKIIEHKNDLLTSRLPWDAVLTVNLLSRCPGSNIEVHRGAYVPTWPLMWDLPVFHDRH